MNYFSTNSVEEDSLDTELGLSRNQRAVECFAKGTGLDNLTAHVLHHTFAKTLIDSGVGLEKVAALLGHSNLNTTRIYTTPELQDLEDAVEDGS